ncbi:alpha/beta fold hydrolase [Epidermidibacterium keratini]|uniref:Alpha/beta fold hydrolase n=1 Tax=Epidermidibacterium keratini TaxID=1891644 RepID=A0A7L4YNX3_9ACTN|nr:alpha/beta hydrolase [Epidermidibacterium keratini]QHC00965.1 alpha/beta fold hydrolase [Epidermidibacterium keratini]
MRSAAVDGFTLEYDDTGSGGSAPVMLLHGWPGDRRDYRALVPLINARTIVPDLRGFGGSDRHEADPAQQYDAAGQARSVIGVLDELAIERAVIGGYDIGSRVAQAIARDHADRVAALVIAPPVPGIGTRILTPQAQREFWYQPFHQLALADRLVSGRDATRAYLEHFWTHWSGPDYQLDEGELDRLAADYSRPGAFAASISWYRAGAGAVATSASEQAPDRTDRIAVPTTILWPSHDPLFPIEWSDRIDEWFSDATLEIVDGVGHFAPLEYPQRFADAINAVS